MCVAMLLPPFSVLLQCRLLQMFIVGKPSDDLPFEERVQVHFHNFADLPQEKGRGLISPFLNCGGHAWSLTLYPRGELNAKEGMVSVYLRSYLSSKIVIDYDIIMKKKKKELLG